MCSLREFEITDSIPIYTNPLGTLSNRHGLNSIDINSNFLYTGDINGHVSSWNLDMFSVNTKYKLDSALITLKYTNGFVISQTKKKLHLLSDDLTEELDRKPSQTHTFARFTLLNGNTVIALPHPEKDHDISLFSIENNRLVVSSHIKIKSGKRTGPLHVLKAISEFELIASHEIGSIFLYDIRKTDSSLTNPVFIYPKSPVHSIEYFNNSIYAGTAEGELYHIKNVYDAPGITKYQNKANTGIGNILKYGNFLMLGCWDGIVRAIDLENFSEKCVYHGHKSTVTDIKIDLENDMLFTAGSDGRICIWELLKLRT